MALMDICSNLGLTVICVLFWFFLNALFFRCFSRNWSVTDYGVCKIMDLLAEIPDTTITVVHQDMDTVISVPKRGPVNAVIRHDT